MTYELMFARTVITIPGVEVQAEMSIDDATAVLRDAGVEQEAERGVNQEVEVELGHGLGHGALILVESRKGIDRLRDMSRLESEDGTPHPSLQPPKRDTTWLILLIEREPDIHPARSTSTRVSRSRDQEDRRVTKRKRWVMNRRSIRL